MRREELRVKAYFCLFKCCQKLIDVDADRARKYPMLNVAFLNACGVDNLPQHTHTRMRNLGLDIASQVGLRPHRAFSI